MVKLLLSRGANINAFDKKDRRAIHWAAYMGEITVIKQNCNCLFNRWGIIIHFLDEIFFLSLSSLYQVIWKL